MKKAFQILSVATIMLAAVSCGGGGKSDPGVCINGVKWATCNIGADGKFVSSPEEIGFNGDFYSIPDSLFPKGWRLPIIEEMVTLINSPHQTLKRNGVQGELFGVEPNAIFLPHTLGFYRNSYGIYWSNTKGNDTYIRTIRMQNPNYLYSDGYNEYGCVRLVYDAGCGEVK
jgi:hypothetical protein